MSWWTDIRDSVEKIATGGLYDPQKSRREEAERRYMINDQIKAYKEQTELSRKQLDETRSEQAAEKRRVQEKQIRSLRRSYSAQGMGMLGTGQAASQDMSNNLGG